MGKVNDRGTKKWTSIMMPEHTKLLEEMWKQQDYRERPMLNDHQIEDINIALQLALKDDLTVEIEYFKNHYYHKTKGKLLSVDVLSQYIQINNDCIPLPNITGAWID
ncbi:YolD-like family protein [Virgibacillus sediminis]|uniref:YolD-like family protein n=1 Tax=Virgibacillus sediminis TaxID=202260 RepID=A0ABV7A6R0_9BACI